MRKSRRRQTRNLNKPIPDGQRIKVTTILPRHEPRALLSHPTTTYFDEQRIIKIAPSTKRTVNPTDRCLSARATRPNRMNG